jgi:tRNA A-37 threonylcarbamoyl transferase component Bud32
MTDDLHRVREALSDRYAIERELGAGGMATVYLARDIKHARDVAVKVMRPELTAAVGSDRFLREIRITAQLNHPHILSLHDSGESDGLLYYVMPYIAAGSLRVRLKREAPLAVEEALRITTQIASALDHAHSHRVIHRDVKPENILFWEGLPVVADFGIAKAVSEADRDNLTRTGVPVGTPGYMSPEQAMGLTVLDERTDVYSLACVVYEMVIGATPAVWSARDSQRLGRFVDAPPEHRECLNLLPGRIEQALVKALAVTPHDRFPSPGDFADALEAALESRAVFSDEQVRELLGRAAELQAEGPGEGEGLTIGAVEQVAADVGIPPEHVREALRQLEGSGAGAIEHAEPGSVARRSERPKFLDRPPGGSKKGEIIIDRTLEDEIPPERFEAIVAEIESRLGTVGHISVLGGILTWSPAAPGSEGRRIVVTVSPTGHLRHKTHIRISETVELVGWKRTVPAWGGIAGGFIGMLLGRAGGEPLSVIVAGALFVVLGVYLAKSLTISPIVASRREELQRLSDRLVAIGEGRTRSQR